MPRDDIMSCPGVTNLYTRYLGPMPVYFYMFFFLCFLSFNDLLFLSLSLSLCLPLLVSISLPVSLLHFGTWS